MPPEYMESERAAPTAMVHELIAHGADVNAALRSIIRDAASENALSPRVEDF